MKRNNQTSSWELKGRRTGAFGKIIVNFILWLASIHDTIDHQFCWNYNNEELLRSTNSNLITIITESRHESVLFIMWKWALIWIGS
jgi:hypothetical protein